MVKICHRTPFRSLCMKTVDQHELHNQLEEAKQKIIQSLAYFKKKEVVGY